MMRAALLFLFAFQLCTVLVFAQNAPIMSPTLLYKKYWSGSGNISTRGWGMGLKYGFHKRDINKATELVFDFARLKHEKEVRITNANFDNPRPYVFGRLNQLFVARLGVGEKFVLSKRVYEQAIVVNFSYHAGLSTAILKPVYLEIFYKGQDQSTSFRTEKYDPAVHIDQSRIYGSAPFSAGLNELGFKAGAFAKTAFTFEWAENDDEIRALEAGAIVDVYPDQIPIMAFSKNHQAFVSLYLAINFGSRW